MPGTLFRTNPNNIDEVQRTLRSIHSIMEKFQLGDQSSLGFFEPGDLKWSFVPYAADSVPDGWALPVGQAVAREGDYARVFERIGVSYGVGDGSTTFNLPDMRGRTPVGLDNLGGTSANRITAAWADTAGGSGGVEEVTLTSAQSGVPAHTHGITDPQHTHSVTDTGHTHTASSSASADDHYHVINAVGTGGGGDGLFPGFGGATRVSGGVVDSGGTPTSLTVTVSTTVNSGTTGISMASATTGVTVNNNIAANAASAHTNIQPSQAVYCLIKL